VSLITYSEDKLTVNYIVSVLDLNMIPYGSSYFVLVVMGVLILAGNTAYPVFLRLCIWCSLEILKLVSYPHDFAEWKATLEYILKYPRRVYTNLFPQRQTWWLVFMLFVLNGTDWVAFEIFNLGNPSLDEIPPGSRVIDGLFQALGEPLARSGSITRGTNYPWQLCAPVDFTWFQFRPSILAFKCFMSS
jgi:Trk-type K+ transport system membrane component